MFKVITICAPSGSDRATLAQKIFDRFGDRIACVEVLDDLLIKDDFVVGQKTREKYVHICSGSNWKPFATKYDLKFFENLDAKTQDAILFWVEGQF